MASVNRLSPPPQITAGLICHREGRSLAGILQDLKSQSAPALLGEVLIAQTGSDPETLKTAMAFSGRLPLKIFPHLENNLGAARALIVSKAKHPLIAWTDSDCRLPPFWLETLLSLWQAHDFEPPLRPLAGVGGPNRLPEDFFWQKMWNLSLSHPLGHGWSPQAWIPKKGAEVSHIPTTNGLFSREKILAAGSFSPKNPRRGEDLALGPPLRKTGRLLLFPRPLVINSHSQSYWGALKRLFLFGRARRREKGPLFYSALLFFSLSAAGALAAAAELALNFAAAPGGGFVWLHKASRAILSACLLYPALLLAFGFAAALREKNPRGLALPAFWAAQHLAYSLGAFCGAAAPPRNRDLAARLPPR